MLLRIYSCLFALVFGFLLTGVASVLLLSGATNFRFDMLPYWKGPSVLFAILALGLVGLLAGFLALVRKVRLLLALFSLLAAGALAYGYFLSPIYRFSGSAEAKTMFWVTAAAAVAFLGSLMQFRRTERA